MRRAIAPGAGARMQAWLVSIGCGLVWAFPVLARASDTITLPRGEVIEAVACLADATQSYALYVPASVDLTQANPVVVCLDAAARGRLPVERFVAGADAFGYIVVGSNNICNEPFEQLQASLATLLDDLFRRFRVDRERLVFAGFSGEARMASAVAQKTGFVRAVIACGASFFGREVPEKPAFAFIGTVGVNDFNYYEMREIDDQLADRSARHRLFTFDGRHEWPPAEVLYDVLAWLELDGMRTGLQAVDAARAEALFTRAVDHATSKAPSDRLLAFRAIEADFSDFVDTSELRAWIEKLEDAPEGRSLAATEKREKQEQAAAVRDLIGLANDEAYATVRGVAERWRQEAEAPSDTSERRIARRVLGDAAAYGFEFGLDALARRRFSKAVGLLELYANVNPGNAAASFALARAYAGKNDRKRALAALRDAVEAGFDNASRIESAEEFRKLRREPAFQAILAELRSSARL